MQVELSETIWAKPSPEDECGFVVLSGTRGEVLGWHGRDWSEDDGSVMDLAGRGADLCAIVEFELATMIEADGLFGAEGAYTVEAAERGWTVANVPASLLRHPAPGNLSSKEHADLAATLAAGKAQSAELDKQYEALTGAISKDILDRLVLPNLKDLTVEDRAAVRLALDVSDAGEGDRD